MTRYSLIAVLFLSVGCSSNSDDPAQGNTLQSAVINDSNLATELYATVRAPASEHSVEAEQFQSVVDALNAFSIKTHQAQSTVDPTANMAISGYSMAVALSFLRAGAANVSDSELAGLLDQAAIDEQVVHDSLASLGSQLRSRVNDRLELNIANRLFVKPGLPVSASFLDIAAGQYAAPVTEMDFAADVTGAIDVINAWTSEQTSGFIKKIATPDNIKANTVLALLNAIFLDAGWQESHSRLEGRAFEQLDGSTHTGPAFTNDTTIPFLIDSDVEVLDIPYSGDELSMFIMMPAQFNEFASSLTPTVLDGYVKRMVASRLSYTVPVYSIENTIAATSLLQPLGLPASSLDLSDMFDSAAMFNPPQVVQKVRIDVDENGTRAAAVTLVAVDESAPPSIVVNKPFLFFLRDRATGVILFSGQVTQPAG